MSAFDRAMTSWFVTFAALLSYWEIGEALQPGGQYASPYLPCAGVACQVAPIVYLSWSICRKAAPRVRRWLDG